MAEQDLALLLVDADGVFAERVQTRLGETIPGMGVSIAVRFDEARTRLVEDPPDLILVADALPDGTCLDVLAFMHQAELARPVMVRVHPGQEAMAMAALKMGAANHLIADTQADLRALPMMLLETMRLYHLQLGARARVEDYHDLLHTIDATITLIKHEINNPLAIISGNAQLLLELTKAIEVDPMFIQPIEDIESSSQRIASLLDKLADLRHLIKDVAHLDDTSNSVQRL